MMETYHTPFPASSSQGRQRGTELGLRNYSILFDFQRQKIPQVFNTAGTSPCTHPWLHSAVLSTLPLTQERLQRPLPCPPRLSLSLCMAEFIFVMQVQAGFCVFPRLWLLAHGLSAAVRESSPSGAEQKNPAHANSTG